MITNNEQEKLEISQSWDADLGVIKSVVPLSRLSRTYKILTSKSVYTVKRLVDLPDPGAFVTTYRALHLHGIPCPRLETYWQQKSNLYCVFQFLEGSRINPKDSSWSLGWQKAYRWLDFLNTLNQDIPHWDLEKRWLTRFEGQFDDHPEARVLWSLLKDFSTVGDRRVAHGDFAPQNMLMGPQGWFILDWEEMGAARPGFDAGWVMALNLQGSGPKVEQTTLEQTMEKLGIPQFNLAWYTGLGLLRVFYRGLTLPLDPFVKELTLLGLKAPLKRHTEKLRSMK